MSVRLACPACRAVLVPGAHEIGRVVPCPGCGRKLRVPGAQRPSPAPVLEIPENEDEPADRSPARAERRPVPARRGSLLWLWVLLGSGVVGAAAGAGGFLLVGRDPRPGAEKPAPEGTQEASDRDPSVNDGPVPAATTFPGLKFYLPFDSISGTAVPEVVSGKAVGTLTGGTLTNGQRGKALRVSVPGSSSAPALALGDQAGAFRVPAEHPFTFSLWVRAEPSAGTFTPSLNVFVGESKPVPGTNDHLQLRIGLERDFGRILASHSVTGRSTGQRQNAANPVFKTPPQGEWLHLVLIRSQKNQVQALVNGRQQAFVLKYPFPIEFETLGMFWASGAMTVEVDELCLFDRALAPDELARLGGRPVGESPPPDDPPRWPSPPPPVGTAPQPGTAAPIATPHPVPPATALEGLQFYLDCDAASDGTVTESVSDKQVGKGAGLQLTDGARGKALRLTHEALSPVLYALDLSDQNDKFVVAVDRPFTLAFWARPVADGPRAPNFVLAFDGHTVPGPKEHRGLHLALNPLQRLADALYEDHPNGPTQAGVSQRVMAPLPEPGRWTHVALVRNPKNEMRLVVNGVPAPNPQSGRIELRYDRIGFVRSLAGAAICDVDEVCLFNRALTADELAQLAGQKPGPAGSSDQVPDVVPAASDFSGLRFHLSCDAIEGAAVRESVSGKLVGKGRGLKLVPGVRGKGIRVTAGGPVGGPREGLDLGASADALAVGEGKPFTLAVWARTDNWNWTRAGPTLVNGKFVDTNKARFFAFYYTKSGLGMLLTGGAPEISGPAASGTVEFPATKEWVHLVLTRDDKGTVRWAVNGHHRPVTTGGTYPGEFRFTELALGWQQATTFTVDFDEFCLFDRVLTDDEIKKLSGRAK